MIAPTVYGDRLRQARILRLEKLGNVAAVLGCTSSALSKWERADEVSISPVQLDRLTDFLRFPSDFFTRPPAAPITDSDLLFRAPKSTLKREKDFLREFMRFTGELIEWLDERRRLPPVKVRTQRPGSISITGAARELREDLGLHPEEPIDYLTHPVERAGIVVVVRRRQLGEGLEESDYSSAQRERHEGCSAWIGEFRERPLIVMRSVQTWEKTRWVLSHELGHLVLHAGRMPVSEHAEEEASRFASELLAPINAITRELPRTITLAALVGIKLKWGISLSALIRHLHANNVISDRRKQTLYAQLYARKNPETGRTYGVTEPGWDARTPERPRLIAAWLSRAVGNVIPEAVAASSKIWPPDLLSEIITEQRPAPRASMMIHERTPAATGDGKVITLPLRRMASGGFDIPSDQKRNST